MFSAVYETQTVTCLVTNCSRRSDHNVTDELSSQGFTATQ